MDIIRIEIIATLLHYTKLSECNVWEEYYLYNLPHVQLQCPVTELYSTKIVIIPVFETTDQVVAGNVGRDTAIATQ